MFIVTDVSPYRDGPAGVHGVLPQAAVALAELAGLASLEAVRVDDVPDVDPAALSGGRRPGAVHDRRDPVDRRAA